MSAAIAPGLHAEFSYTVTDADTAAALESGLVPVLSTPRVLALMERATVEALEGALDQGTTTVGTRVELEHLLATPVGVPVQVSATLEVVDGRRLDFSAEVTDGGRVAARGRVTRVLVDLERFLAAVPARRPWDGRQRPDDGPALRPQPGARAPLPELPAGLRHGHAQPGVERVPAAAGADRPGPAGRAGLHPRQPDDRGGQAGVLRDRLPRGGAGPAGRQVVARRLVPVQVQPVTAPPLAVRRRAGPGPGRW